MPKTLLLMRHGEAVASTPDVERRLTERGINEVIRAAKKLQEREVVLDQMLYSTAERTSVTAEYLAQINRFDSSTLIPRPDFYQAAVGGMLQCVNELDSELQAVGIIGHNPTLSYLVEYLADNANNIFLDTANIALLSFDTNSWVGVGQYTGKLEWHHKSD